MRTRSQVVGIQYAVGGGFFLIVAFSWIAEFAGTLSPDEGDESIFNWVDPLIENVAVCSVAIPVMILLRRLLSRLHYLESFLSVCAWCKKVDHHGEWISMGDFFAQKFQTETSHGICLPCSDMVKARAANEVVSLP